MAFRPSKSSRVNKGFTISPGPRQLAKELDQLKKDMLDLRPVWPKVSDRVKASITGAFGSRGGNIGEPWSPLSRDYAKRVGSSRPTLNRSGALMAQATSGRATKLMKPLSFVYRIKGDYVRVHEFGSKKVPKRSYAQMSPHSEESAAQDIEQHIQKQIREFENNRASNVFRGI